ncbi:hypothetical protein [Paucisalibacillus globulus]|uniref:hypothetical protein n=1 Tax=Paucisalibacillus globulus TaxID=351095 RepID=UPI00040875D4|nr:hypothetical protein [Paucisalibacillus globulus]
MHNLSHNQAIEKVNELLGEDLRYNFEEQLETAGDHGYPSFLVKNSKGKEVQIMVDWDKEADILSFTIGSENA